MAPGPAIGLKRKQTWPNKWGALASPWVVIGSAAVLAAIVIILGLINHNRENRYMSDILKEKGVVVIKAFEAGARTGMRGHLGQGAEIQALVEELSQYSDILYLAITDGSGRILAHTDQSRIGQVLISESELLGLGPGRDEKWRLVREPNGKRSFEVYKEFLAEIGRGHGMRRQGCRDNDFWCSGKIRWPSQTIPGNSDEKTAVFVGLDSGPFDAARRHDTRLMLVITTVLILLGFGGVVSLFWAHHYRVSRSLMLDARALASEVVANLPVGLIVTDRDGRVAYLNEVAEGIAATPAAQMTGQPATDVLPNELTDLSDRLDREEAVLEKEMEIAFKPGKLVPLSLSVSCIITEEGNFVGHIYIFRDLGEIRRLQAEVQRQEKLAAIGNLAAGVAHEIRNPLSSIKGYATYFGSRFQDGSEDKKAAQVMAGEVDRLNKVITELLEFARPSDLKPAPVDLQTLIDNSLRLIRQDAALKHIDVSTAIEKNLPPVTLDADRLTQALLNMYLNAIQAMDDGGALTVRAGLAFNNHVFLEITDTGQGIPSENLTDIFNPYFTTKNSGTGLGLAIVHKIVEAHSGQVQVRSTRDKGAAFTLYFPMSPENS